MSNGTSYREAGKVIGLCVCWYIMSSGSNIIGKTILVDFPYPMTVTMIQLMSISVYLGPILRIMNVPSAQYLPWRYYFAFIIPLSCAKFLASVSSHVSIWRVSLSYAHTVKATLPLFTVILSRIILGEKQSTQVYVSLLPIIGGVVTATLTELSFDAIGLFSALLATVGFSLQNIFSKKCLKDTGMHHLRLLLILSRLAVLGLFPLWLIFDVRKMLRDDNIGTNKDMMRISWLLLADGMCNSLQSVLAFTVLAMVAPLSYAIANASKRIVIISASVILLKNPVSLFNVIGMLCAITGVFLYNKARYDQNRTQYKQSILPYVHSESNLQVPKNTLLNHSNSDFNFQKNGLDFKDINHFKLIAASDAIPLESNGRPGIQPRATFQT